MGGVHPPPSPRPLRGLGRHAQHDDMTFHTIFKFPRLASLLNPTMPFNIKLLEIFAYTTKSSNYTNTRDSKKNSLVVFCKSEKL